MRNLHLSELIIHDFHPDLSNVKKIIRRTSQSAVLAFDNVYFINETGKLVKVNHYPVRDVEWLQIKNVIFMWTTSKFEWYDVARGTKQMLDVPGVFESCAWNRSQAALALLYGTGRVQIVAFDFDKHSYVTVANNHNNQESNCNNNNDKLPITTTTIVWNKEGDCFASVFSKKNSLVFEIYSEHCELLASGECEDINLQPVLAWQPDGCTVAILHEHCGSYYIHMFENNGLRKYNLPLDFVRGTLKNVKLEWNSTGDVLAVHCTTELESTLSLYSHRNYKWDLKQQLLFDNGVEIQSFCWMSCQQSHVALQVISSLKELHYFFNWAVDATSWQESVLQTSENLAVIDGSTLRLTNIVDELRPPPLSTRDINYPKPVNIVRFSPKGMFILAVLCDNIAYVTAVDGSKSFQLPLATVCYYESVPLSFNNFSIDDNANVYFIKNSNKSCSRVVQVEKPIDKLLNASQHVRIMCTLDVRITYMAVTNNVITVRSEQGVFTYKLEALRASAKSELFGKSVPAGQIAVVHKNNASHLFSLSENNLYMDNCRLVLQDVTSYLICHNYMMITTADETLLCYELHARDLEKLANGSRQNVFSRPIPKGAVLITAIPRSTSIVLQLERGDLELIKPRILSVRLVSRLLRQTRYTEAFAVVKYDRLNTNIIVDLNPDGFMENIDEFISSIREPETLNLFITGLLDDNIVSKLYRNCTATADEKVTILQDKKTAVLNRMIDAMVHMDRGFYLQSIITANLMLSSNEGMEAAVKELKWGMVQQETDLQFPIDEIFYRIVPLTSEEELLKAALSMQDLKLVQWIASRTQLDPLEYIPFFRELSRMEPNYRAYKINNHLKRYDLAFEKLIECDGVEQEIIQLIEKADLYKVAVQKTPQHNQWYSIVLTKCAAYLFNKQTYTEAGILFKKIGKYDEAFECFINAGDFEQFTKLTDSVKTIKSASSVRVYYERLVKRLREVGDKRQTARVYEILNDYEQAVSLLISHKDWSEAMLYIAKYNRKDLIVTDFYPAILEYSQQLCQLFEQKKLQFTNYKQRLESVRSEKVKLLTMKQIDGIRATDNLPIDYEEPDAIRNADLESLLSILSVTTQQTGFTNTSSSTTRRKKKLARKTQEIREGSVFENIALVRQLHMTATEMNGYAGFVRSTCLHLLELDGQASQAAARLHATYSDVITIMETSANQIWPQDFINPPRPLNVQAAVLRLNLEHLEPQYRYPPDPLSPDWRISILSV